MYFDLESNRNIAANELRVQSPLQQRSVMEQWFRSKYEDPAERTPYESAEGGYIWIWGGPFDARDKLQSEFGGVVPSAIIDQLADDLESECPEWAPTVREGDYDDFAISDIARITTYYHSFEGAILDIEALLRQPIADQSAGVLHRLLYVNVITALETYLSDAFISTVFNDQRLLRLLVETTPEFRAEKLPLADVFKTVDQIESRVRRHLADVVWHRIERITPMYRDTLGIRFPDDLDAIFAAVLIRHDIVHRNGKTKDGKDIVISPAQVRSLIACVEGFVRHVDSALSDMKGGQVGEQREPNGELL